MSTHFVAPGAPQKRLADYLNGLAQAAGGTLTERSRWKPIAPACCYPARPRTKSSLRIPKALTWD